MNIQFDAILKNALVETVLDEYENAICDKAVASDKNTAASGRNTAAIGGNSDMSAHAHGNNGNLDDLTEKTVEESVFEDYTELLRSKRDTTSNCLKQVSEEDLSTDEGRL